MFRLLKLVVALASLAALMNLVRPAQPESTLAQTACPTSASAGSLNGVMSIDSAVQVTSGGCSSGTSIGYWVYIPGNSSHAAAWHEFAVSTGTSTWLDLNRNEGHATEFPPGSYQFAACASQCAYSSTVTLSAPAGTAGGGFNPWAGGASNMQWNRGLCETNGSCSGSSQTMYGFDLGFTAATNNTGDGTNDCPANCLYHNLNTYFGNPNPGDTAGGFTQLVVSRHTGGYAYLFYVFSNSLVYCRTNSAASITSPIGSCSSSLFSYDGARHAFWANIAPAQQCTDTRYQCLKVYDDGRYLADERMVNGGVLNSPFVQNESYTTSGCSVWGAQLNYTDYGMLAPCALNNGLSVYYPTDYAYYQVSQGGGWGYLYNNAGDAGSRSIGNQGTTFDVYCGGFSSQFPSATSMQFGTLLNAHPCMGGSPN